MLSWLKSLSGTWSATDRSDRKFAAKTADVVHQIVREQIDMADADPFQLDTGELEFMMGYIFGFSDVMAQASGEKAGGSLSVLICGKAMQMLYGNTAGEAMLKTAVGIMGTGSELFTKSMVAGGEDANLAVRKGWPGKLADYLMKHKKTTDE